MAIGEKIEVQEKVKSAAEEKMVEVVRISDLENRPATVSLPVADSAILSAEDFVKAFSPKFKIIPATDPIRALQTVIRDRDTSRSDFVFYADRLIRLVVEEGLNQLPYEEHIITTPTGQQYKGLKFLKGNCGVSVVRSGEAMEQGLRDCCRSIRIGKILVEKDEETHEARVVYAKFPEDIASRKVLLMSVLPSTRSHHILTLLVFIVV